MAMNNITYRWFSQRTKPPFSSGIFQPCLICGKRRLRSEQNKGFAISARHWKCRLGWVNGKIIPKWCITLNIYIYMWIIMHIYIAYCMCIEMYADILYWYTIFPLPKSNWFVPGSNLLLSDLLAPLLSSWIIAASVGICPCPCCHLFNVQYVSVGGEITHPK